MNALTPLLPALRSLEPLGLPSSALPEWFAYANQRQAARLAVHVQAEFATLLRAFAGAVDHAYLRSDAFQANVVQAVRAAEIAESEDKLRFIARALAGCVLSFPPPAPDRFQTMRVIEGLSDRELRVFVGLFDLLDPIDPFGDSLPVNGTATVAGLSRQEFASALLGLAQQGFLNRADVRRDEWSEPEAAWTLTALARQVAVLTRLGGNDWEGDL
ncbi:hypothetical protein CBQ26_11000 [Deinococcus indicus]|uniref:Uncharacterized protein n=1 Tax=Deinococcus indicus TaxID=223556 RepID=A0A246BKF0_9DEIO|nr:hypothetical protein [Deinococcus indicus]OWL95793.1 hypothetical protein CBQ26_11000 [Deinococcus indicus]GHG24888.1 hypothetical protein GCM10017784_16370 [Deinococcus indicus]